MNCQAAEARGAGPKSEGHLQQIDPKVPWRVSGDSRLVFRRPAGAHTGEGTGSTEGPGRLPSLAP